MCDNIDFRPQWADTLDSNSFHNHCKSLKMSEWMENIIDEELRLSLDVDAENEFTQMSDVGVISQNEAASASQISQNEATSASQVSEPSPHLFRGARGIWDVRRRHMKKRVLLQMQLLMSHHHQHQNVQKYKKV